MATNLKILVVELDPTKAREIIDALMDGGWKDVTVIATAEALDRTLKLHNPDIILIDLAIPDRGTLEHMSFVSNALRRPVGIVKLRALSPTGTETHDKTQSIWCLPGASFSA